MTRLLTGILRTRSDESARRSFEESEHRLFARYGLSPQSRFVELIDPSLRARVVEAGEGPPVLLVHGGGCVAALWAPLMAELPGLRLIAVDRPGCGLTEAFDYRGVDLHRHAVAFLASLLDELGVDRVPIIANSMGGLWSLWLALERPERVSGLALLGAPAGVLDVSAPFPMRLLTLPVLGRGMLAMEPPSRRQVRRTFQRLGHRAIDGWADEIWDTYEAYERLPASASGYRTLVQRTVRLRGTWPEVVFGPDHLRGVNQPTLYLWGDADVFGSPEVGRRAAALMPSASCHEVPGGHLPWLDDPERCAEVVAPFLGETTTIRPQEGQ